jgi:hypothetical protein
MSTQTVTTTADLAALPARTVAVTNSGTPIVAIGYGRVKSLRGVYLAANWHEFPRTVAWSPTTA